ncbi:hypothetical protein Anapl_05825 [Anas platyrhynchos]|uniref:Uncharacterized protein n=1 Tax=Anas platyrhynchos TaxID=8839 RepID=R0LF80_ANAPL|nr:hypothetical protein Anapl_05825 [Anas platyrhynchos]
MTSTCVMLAVLGIIPAFCLWASELTARVLAVLMTGIWAPVQTHSQEKRQLDLNFKAKSKTTKSKMEALRPIPDMGRELLSVELFHCSGSQTDTKYQGCYRGLCNPIYNAILRVVPTENSCSQGQARLPSFLNHAALVLGCVQTPTEKQECPQHSNVQLLTSCTLEGFLSRGTGSHFGILIYRVLRFETSCTRGMRKDLKHCKQNQSTDEAQQPLIVAHEAIQPAKASEGSQQALEISRTEEFIQLRNNQLLQFTRCTGKENNQDEVSLTPFYISANVRRASVPCVTNPRDRGVYTEGGLRVSVSVEVRAPYLRAHPCVPASHLAPHPGWSCLWPLGSTLLQQHPVPRGDTVLATSRPDSLRNSAFSPSPGNDLRNRAGWAKALSAAGFGVEPLAR